MSDEETEGRDALVALVERYDDRQIDGTVGFAAALDDHATPSVVQFIVFRPRDGEEAVPIERAIVLCRGFAENLRKMAGELDGIAKNLEREIAPAGKDAN